MGGNAGSEAIWEIVLGIHNGDEGKEYAREERVSREAIKIDGLCSIRRLSGQ
jgi:hypothetical protein